MPHKYRTARLSGRSLMFCLLGLLPALPAVADTTPAAPSAAEAAPSPNATIPHGFSICCQCS